jgi:hypothetical protein
MHVIPVPKRMMRVKPSLAIGRRRFASRTMVVEEGFGHGSFYIVLPAGEQKEAG